MNVTTIAMSKDQALAAFREYQAAVRADRPGVRKVWKDEDIGLMQAYKHLAKGHAILDLDQAMKQTGVKVFAGACPLALPVLAICPSDASTCYVEMKSQGGAVFSAETLRWKRAKVQRSVILPDGTFPQLPEQGWQHAHQSTLVPLIPPLLRPKFNLGNYRTLWEVESWTQEPPKDPMLLKKLGGSLYAVLATWDLTDVERAVLRGRK